MTATPDETRYETRYETRLSTRDETPPRPDPTKGGTPEPGRLYDPEPPDTLLVDLETLSEAVRAFTLAAAVAAAGAGAWVRRRTRRRVNLERRLAPYGGRRRP